MNNIFFLRIVDMAIVHLVRYHMSEFRNMHIPDLIIKRNEEKKYYAAACQQSYSNFKGIFNVFFK